MQMQSSGFKVEQFRKLNNWKLLEMDASIPLTVSFVCPADGKEIRVLCTFVGNGGAQKMRIGSCESCGYTGYIDRPTKEWIGRFYSESWDKGNPATQEERVRLEVGRRKIQFNEGLDKLTNRTYILQNKLKGLLKKDRPICEIGCGYGFELQHLKDWGFSQLTGLEASPHRAEVARRAFGHEIFTAPFENAELQEKLRAKGPFGLIYSHHVFEHVYDPDEIIRLVSGLQEEGDYFMITLPNFEGEFSLGTLFFLPHLHTFTKYALAKLLAKYGYEVADDSLCTKYEISFAAKKVQNPKVKEPERKDFFEQAIAKFSNYFRFPKEPAGRKVFWGSRDIDVGGYLPYRGDFLTRIMEVFTSRLFTLRHKKELTVYIGTPPHDWRGIISLVVSPLENRKAHSPIEIQFEKNVKLAYK
ncbi:MAG: class I SAM-dependent methyltransferase [Candidatus Sungbacteria bacterium]|nr:class I SAM-dependent methyltransferase [Candidatus Sungbacteria bacterium]